MAGSEKSKKDTYIIIDGEVKIISPEAVEALEKAARTFGLNGKEESFTLALEFLKVATDSRQNGKDVAVVDFDAAAKKVTGVDKVVAVQQIQQIPEGVVIPKVDLKAPQPKKKGGHFIL